MIQYWYRHNDPTFDQINTCTKKKYHDNKNYNNNTEDLKLPLSTMYANSSKFSKHAATRPIDNTLTKVPHAVPTLICQGASLYLKFLVKKGHNSKSIAFKSYVPCSCILS